MWTQAEANGTFGALIRLALLTGQRQDKLASMKWSDVKDGVWTIDTEEREKGNAGELVLPDEAVASLMIIDDAKSDQARSTSSPPLRHRLRLGLVEDEDGHSTRKVKIAPWTFHDLRRTAKCLDGTCRSVRPHISERVMGHAIAGVEGVYDRHQYETKRPTR